MKRRLSVVELLTVASVFFFVAGIAIETLGRVEGWLRPLAIACGLVWTTLGLRLVTNFFREIRAENGRMVVALTALVIVVQMFWAFFRAPVDVDGIFYHLTIALEALQKNRWGAWDFLIWQIQNTPKFAEHSTLWLIATWGYRAANFAQLPFAFLGALAASSIARTVGARKPSRFGLLFLFTPIVLKQMTSNYVDMTLAAFLLTALALSLALVDVGRPRGLRWFTREYSVFWGFSAAVGCLVSIKMNGVLLLLALFPVIVWVWRRLSARERSFTCVMTALCVLGSLATWMVPNIYRFGNPVFPLRPLGPLTGASILPAEIPVEILHGPASRLADQWALPLYAKWFLQFFVLEPVAQYDNNSGAFGPVGLWAVTWLIFSFSALWRSGAAVLRRRDLAFWVWVVLALTFVLTPGRVTPRYAMIGGLALVVPAFWAWDQRRLGRFSRFWTSTFAVACVLQIFYLLPDRIIFRGLSRGVPFDFNTQTVVENFRDVIEFGEPQTPGRYLHFPYVPAMRRDEPREVVADGDCVDLTALYFGRHFQNHVTVLPSCCRWPYCNE